MVAAVQSLVDNKVDNKQDAHELVQLFNAQQRAYGSLPMPTLKERLRTIDRLMTVIVDYKQAIADAIEADYGVRPRAETALAEILTSIEGLKYIRHNLRLWMKPQKRHVGLMMQPGQASVMYQPLGVVGIISPWNYPFYLAMAPLGYALAAGNRVMLKPSESTSHLSGLLATIFSKSFSAEQIAVVEGEADVAAAFSELPFDHLFFTGSTAIGRFVARAAAENLTPVTLELGGKSATVVDERVNLDIAAERIVMTKLFNAGQTCVAPDYILCHKDQLEVFARKLRFYAKKYFAKAEDLTSIINERHFERLHQLIKDARNKGADVDVLELDGEPHSRHLPLHIVTRVSDDMRLMQEEVFGPILPIKPFDAFSEVLAYINSKPRPLVINYFGKSKQSMQALKSQTHSGGISWNEALYHVGVDDLPFGGVGYSGMGRYHGVEGFRTFSNVKALFKRPGFSFAKYLYPPYGRAAHEWFFKYVLRR